MPDWSYHPLLRPAGIALHGDQTRTLALRRLGHIASVAPGRWFIRFMGHMRAEESLAISKAGFELPGPVMLTSSIDPQGVAFKAFSEFAFGAIEVDGNAGVPESQKVVQVKRFKETGMQLAPTDIVRCGIGDVTAAHELGHPLVVGLNIFFEDQDIRVAADVGAKAFILEGDVADEVLVSVARLRRLAGDDALIAAGGFVSTPRDAIALRKAGADVIVVSEGLATAGPGIAKRINEALLAVDGDSHINGFDVGSLFAVMFGVGVIIAGLIAAYLALTTVILSYDEHFVHLNRAQIEATNPHLLHFMKHDRLSYAGATLSLGIFYAALALFGVRARERWAIHTFMTAGVCGFATLALFVLFHYFDYGNMAVALVLLPFFVVAVVKRPAPVASGSTLDLDNDVLWRRALIGQLLLVMLAIGLIVGGVAICVVGGTHVFVISDLQYLQTTSHHLRESHSQLLPLIAHDRVSFGGAIVCNGVALLLISLWGFTRGAAWIWWAILSAGCINLACTLFAHFSTGYTEFGHLFPVFVGAVFFTAGLVLTRPYLCERGAPV